MRITPYLLQSVLRLTSSKLTACLPRFRSQRYPVCWGNAWVSLRDVAVMDGRSKRSGGDIPPQPPKLSTRLWCLDLAVSGGSISVKSCGRRGTTGLAEFETVTQGFGRDGRGALGGHGCATDSRGHTGMRLQRGVGWGGVLQSHKRTRKLMLLSCASQTIARSTPLRSRASLPQSHRSSYTLSCWQQASPRQPPRDLQLETDGPRRSVDDVVAAERRWEPSG